MNLLDFIRQFVAQPGSTGAIAASSQGLAQLITDEADLAHAQAVVEFGPGSGVFTEQIQRKLAPDATFFAMEVNAEFVLATRARCPDVTVYQDSAVQAEKYLKQHGHETCDCVICGLPWAAFPETLQDELLQTIQTILRPGGRFLTFAYLQGLLLPAGLRFRKKLKGTFGQVTTTRTVWRNVPPAFVYCAAK
jgi:phosphatidylethanolamine/phosphatidyl-N-methylethanolamine N-methyltransferase